jgi:hypothetical protein
MHLDDTGAASHSIGANAKTPAGGDKDGSLSCFQ